jgi:hypothetical protein
MSIYISLTSIFQKQHTLTYTLLSLVSQTRLPKKIFLFLSEEPYLIDSGFRDKKITHPPLIKVLNDNPIIEVRFVENTGPYRKLLPILQEKWDEEGAIFITVDDDCIYNNTLCETLVNSYSEHKVCVGPRGFTPKMESFDSFDYNTRMSVCTDISTYNFLTGLGGILYARHMFEGVEHILFNKDIYTTYCPTADDVWFYLLRVHNNQSCQIIHYKYYQRDLSVRKYALSANINCRNNTNTRLLRNTHTYLKGLLV